MWMQSGNLMLSSSEINIIEIIAVIALLFIFATEFQRIIQIIKLLVTASVISLIVYLSVGYFIWKTEPKILIGIYLIVIIAGKLWADWSRG